MNTATVPRFFPRGFLALLAALLPSLAPALDLDEAEQIRKVERQLAAALAKNDVEVTAQLLTDAWLFVGSDGELVRRDDVLGALRSGQLKFESYELGPMKVRVYGDIAVVIGSGTSTGSMAGEEFHERDVFTDVFLRKDGQWRCVSTHSTDLEN
jgi:uncharacterized protein (TIGR02246 family)